MTFLNCFTNLKALRKRAITLFRIQLKPLLLRKPIFFFYKKLGPHVVTRDDLTTNHKQYLVRHFASKEVITASDSYTWGKIPQEMEKALHHYTITINEPFICEVTNAELVGPAAVGFNETGNIILETTTPTYSLENHLEGSVSIRALFLKSLYQVNVPQLDTAYSLVNAWSRSYWHWIIECLPRLEGVEFFQNQTGIKPVIIIEPNPTSWQIDSLKLLGYDLNDCVYWNKEKLQIKRLIVSSYRKQYDQVYGIQSPSACRWVRQRVLSNITENESSDILFSSRIFVSRRKALSRKITNENDVIEALAKFGFVDYILEEISFLEQVKLFAQAKVVVAPHGAGLTNIIFAQNLTVIELISSSVPLSFSNISRGLGFQYGCFKCQSSRPGIRHQDSDMLVDIDELMDFVLPMLKC